MAFNPLFYIYTFSFYIREPSRGYPEEAVEHLQVAPVTDIHQRNVKSNLMS